MSILWDYIKGKELNIMKKLTQELYENATLGKNLWGIGVGEDEVREG